MMIVTPGGTELTASGQAFAMMQHHAGGVLRHASPNAVVTEQDGTLTMTAVNPSFDQPRTVQLCAGGEPSALLYAGSRAAPFTRFDLQPVAPERKDDAWQVVMPPHSMLLVKIRPEQ